MWSKQTVDIFKKKMILACLTASLLIPSLISAIDAFSTYEKAELYHNHSFQQWQVAYEALKAYSFQGHESVIEIGCRSGRIAANIAGRVPQGEVIATEMRGQGAIEFAIQNHSKSLYPNLSFLEQDFLDSEFDGQFDLAVSFSSLHWFLDQKSILQKVYLALKPQGKILFTIPGKPLPEISALFAVLMNKEEWKPYFETYSHPRKKFTAEEYRSFLLSAGFEPIDIRMQRRKYFFENKRALIDWFRAFSPILDCLPEEKKEEFLSDFSNLYTQYFPIEADGQIPFIQDELFIQAKRS